jgi:hypothetical protein
VSNQTKLSEKIWEKSSGWVDQIGVVIGKMAHQLGVASEHVYEVYTKQVFFEGLVYSSLSALFILILVIANIVVWVNTRYSDNDNKWFARGIAFVVLFIFGGMIAMEGLVPNLLKVFNPEYYTIKEIMNMLKGVVK